VGEIRIKKKEKKEIESLIFTAFCEVWRRGTNASKKHFILIFRSEVMRARF
jgi:predicted transcriptional regulator